MDWFVLQPQVLSRSAELLLVGLISVYLITRADRSQASKHLTAAMILTGLMTVSGLVSRATNLPPPFPDWLAALTYVFPMAALPFSILFAFEFLGNPFPRTRVVVSRAISVAATVAILWIGVSVVSSGYLAPQMLIVVSAVFLIGYLVNLGVFAAKTIVFTKHGTRSEGVRRSATITGWRNAFVHPVGREARANRAFTILFLLPLLQAAVIALRSARILSLGLAGYLTLIIPMIAFAGFAVIYVNYTPERTTFKVKLVGMTVVALVSIIGLIGSATVHPNWMAMSGFELPSSERLVFTPAGAGLLELSRQPLRPLPEDGIRMELSDDAYDTVQLPFAFPFGGRRWNSVIVSSNGAVSFGSEISPGAVSGAGYVLRDFESPVPKIAPAFVDLDPSLGGDILVNRDSASVLIRWRNVPLWGGAGSITAGVLLKPDGTFEFIYGAEQRGAVRLGLVGFRGPDDGTDLAHAIESDSFNGGNTIPVNSIAKWDVARRHREAVHYSVLMFLVAMLAGVACVLLIFPLVIEKSLVRPLRSLLSGVRRINEGDLDTQIPVHAYDELGTLTLNFNRMTLALSRAQAELKSYAEELELKVARRTKDLQQEKGKSEAQKEEAETQRQLAEQALEVVAEQAKKLRELDTLKSAFFANVSHEFRTPLTLTIGPLEDLTSGLHGELPEEVEREIDLVLRNARRLLRLVTQILDISKLESGQMQLSVAPHDLKELLSELRLAFSPLVERKQIDLQLNLPEHELELWCDVDHIEKVLTNLLSNAFKYTDRSGSVRITAKQEVKRVEGTPVECVSVAVKDSGRGISPEDLPHIFDRFYQAGARGQRFQPGTGIGLALAKELIELHHGWIEVESEKGFGTTFTVWLRRGRGHLDPAGTAGTGRPGSDSLTHLVDPEVLIPADTVKEEIDGQFSDVDIVESDDVTTILIVDDNPEIRALLRKYLEKEYKVVEAANGADGLDLAMTELPDLIISDVKMPDLDGIQFCQRIRSSPDLEFIPVILLSARVDDEHKLAGLRKGADAYIPKPFDRKELVTRVDALIASRKRLRERLDKRLEIHASDVDVESSDSAFLKNVKNAVEAHIDDEHFSVEVLARVVGMSRGHLHRRLKHLLQKTPSETVRDIRLERACQLLRGKAGTVSEIAYSVGFRSVSHFSRSFKAVYGSTPSQMAEGTDGGESDDA